MAELLIAAEVSAELAGTIAAVAQVAAVAASVAIGQQQQRSARRRAREEYNRGLRDQMITVKGGVNTRPLIYGRACVGGQLLYAETMGSRKEFLVMVVGLAHGEVQEIETVYFDDIALTIDGSNNVTTPPYYISGDEPAWLNTSVPGTAPYQVTLPVTPVGTPVIQDMSNGSGGGDSGAPPLLQAGSDFTVAGAVITFASALAGRNVVITYSKAVTGSAATVIRFTGATGQDISSTLISIGAPSWTSADKCDGFTGLIVTLSYGETVWPSGIPNIKAVIKGRKVYDPRSSTTVWSRNAALCARDYLTYLYGVNAAGGKIDDAACIAAANICDEDVQLTATPTYQDRYTFDGAVNTGDDRLSNLELFAQAMAGSINYSQGKWRIRPGAYTAPALTLDESKLSDAGSVKIVPFVSRRDLINGCKGTYVNADKGWIVDQFPEWSSATFVSEDGGAPMTSAIELRQVTDSARAQRLAKIAVYRAREQLTLECNCNLSTYAWQVGDMVSVTLARYGFSAKPFRIQRRSFDARGGMMFTLREEPSGLYDWNLGEASVLSGAGNTTLPNPAAVVAPTITGINSAGYLYKAGDGTFVARILVSITSPADEYVRKGGQIQLEYKRGDWSAVQWVRITAPGDATAVWIDPAFDGQNYLIRVRAVNNAGFASAWTAPQAHACIGRPGVTANMLANSDWTDDLGYAVNAAFADTRTLRGWSPGGNPALFARNYAGGTAWNFGNGGCWFYIPSNTVGHYAYVYQDVPVVAGVAYEASVYVSTHRGISQLQIQYLDAAKNTILGNPADAYDSLTAVDGGQYDFTTHRRLWCTGTAPANTAYARVICLVQCTSSSSPYPFTAWSKALLCVAPDGVTRATATPWVEGNPSTVDGQTVGTWHRYLNQRSFSIIDDVYEVDTFGFTPTVPGILKVRVTAGTGFTTASGATRSIEMQIWQGGAMLTDGARLYLGNGSYFQAPYSDTKDVFVQAGLAVDVRLIVRVEGWGGADETAYIYYLTYNATITRLIQR
jgi:hypothetical protein